VHEVDVDDDMATITDSKIFQERLQKHLPRH
jgi:hypothetical protein